MWTFQFYFISPAVWYLLSLPQIFFSLTLCQLFCVKLQSPCKTGGQHLSAPVVPFFLIKKRIKRKTKTCSLLTNCKAFLNVLNCRAAISAVWSLIHCFVECQGNYSANVLSFCSLWMHLWWNDLGYWEMYNVLFNGVFAMSQWLVSVLRSMY